MKRASCVAAIAATLTATCIAQAQPPTAETPTARRPIGAPSKAFELSVAGGYTQGFGNLKSGVGLPSVALGGMGLDLGAGYRINPRWAILGAGQYQELTAERAAATRGFTVSVAAQYHFSPARQLDPWLEAGSGYRFFWENPSIGPTVLSHGWQIARVRFGVDFRTDEQIAFGPVVGADATMFMFENAPDTPTGIGEPRLSTFIYAGLQGRFDFGGKTSSTVSTVSKR